MYIHKNQYQFADMCFLRVSHAHQQLGAMSTHQIGPFKQNTKHQMCSSKTSPKHQRTLPKLEHTLLKHH